MSEAGLTYLNPQGSEVGLPQVSPLMMFAHLPMICPTGKARAVQSSTRSTGSFFHRQ